jgi:hypothetical protein
MPDLAPIGACDASKGVQVQPVPAPRAFLRLIDDVNGLEANHRRIYTPRPRHDVPFGKLSMNRRARKATLVLIGLMLLSESGCVRRRLNVRSNPPGALVYVDNQQIGTTPCSVDFTYYGTREIRLIKPGYETLTVNQPIPTPWYQIPPLDFISENLTPVRIRDNRTVSFDMAPQIIVPTDVIVDRASQLRQETQQYPVAPAAVTIPPGPPAMVAPMGPAPVNMMPAPGPVVAPGAPPILPPP